MAASTVSREWLEWVGQLATGEPRARGLRSAPDRFSCWLEKQPDLLVPRRFAGADSPGGMVRPDLVDDCELLCNPSCVLCEQGDVPAELNGIEEWRDGFALSDQSTAWVHNADRQQWHPFWMEEDLASRVRDARESGRVAGFNKNERQALLSAGILTTEAKIEAARKQWGERAEQNRERFRERGYTAVDGLLHPFHIGELRRYYRRLIRRGRVALGDYQSARRYVAHNEPIERFFHLQLKSTIEQLVGEPVKPSYVYLASYLSGARLPRHTDREQCEFGITFCLDYAPEPDGATPWPLHLETGRGRVTVEQALGDALLYRGCELPHYRDPLPDGHLSTSIFFHYVRADFQGALS
jgi:hypothetical protein